MFNQVGDDPPFLHILPSNPGEHFSTFQHRLMLSLHERSHPYRPYKPQYPPLPHVNLLNPQPQMNLLNHPTYVNLLSPQPQLNLLNPPIQTILPPSPDQQMEVQPNQPGPEPPHDAHSIPLPELEPGSVSSCVIGTEYIGVLTMDGQAGRIHLEVLQSPTVSLADSWTPHDEEVARQLRPQLEAEIPDAFSRLPHGLGITNILTMSQIRPYMPNNQQLMAEVTEQTDLSTLLHLSEVEWLTGDQVFCHIAVLNSEILLVSCGHLYSWAVDASCVVPHPKSADLQLTGEEIVSLSAGRTRATFLTRSNRVATLYDHSITRHTDGSHDNLMRVLSHPLTHVPVSEGDTLKEVAVSETISCVRSASGRVFWWGLLPLDMRNSPQNPKSGPAIRLRSLVSLRQEDQSRKGSLVMNFSTPGGASVARLTSLSSSDVSVEMLTGCGGNETWKLSEVVFLEEESRPPILGRVVALNKEFVAVNTSQYRVPDSSSEGDIQLFSLSELQSVGEEDTGEIEVGRTRSCVHSHASCRVQAQPICIVEPANTGDDEKGAVSGFRCLALTCHSEGPLLLLERVSDGHAYILNSTPNPKLPGTSTVYTGPLKNKFTWTNATIEQESTPTQIAGLHTHVKFATSPLANTPILLDTHGYIRPIQSCYRLCPPFWHLPLPFNSLSISLITHRQREYYLVLCHPKKRGIVSSIEANDFAKCKQQIDTWVQQSASNSEQVSPAVKRAKVGSEGSMPVESADLLERSCGNRNILHACILPSDRKRRDAKKKKYFKMCFEEIRWNHYGKDSYKIHSESLESERTRTLTYLLSLPPLSPLLQELLAQTDASGRTPFMLALHSQDLVAANRILKFVESSSLRQQSHLYQHAIMKPSSDGTSPLQALVFNAALPHGQFGLRTLLVLTNSTLTQPHPKALLNFFKMRYPSVYRCEALTINSSPLSEESKVLPSPCFRESLPNRRTYTDAFNFKPHKTFHLSSNSLHMGHLISFGSIWELRRALCELNGVHITRNSLHFKPDLHVYHGEALGASEWEKSLKKQYTEYSRGAVDTELMRVSLFKRLMEFSTGHGGEENILSSLLHDKPLVQYLQDMSRIGERVDSEEFCFGAPLLSEHVPVNHHTLLRSAIVSQINSPVLPLTSKDEDPIEEREDKLPIENILHIVSGSWEVVSAAILRPGGGDTGHEKRDSFTFALLVDTPDSVLSTFLQTLFSKLEGVDPDKLYAGFMSPDPSTIADDESHVIAVVKRFIQSLIRLYNNSISSQKHFLIPDASSTTSIPNRNATLIPINRRVSYVQYRIYRVLSTFRSLAVWEMFVSARGLCWPLIAGDSKQYPKEFDVFPSNQGMSVLGYHSQGTKALEWYFHCEISHPLITYARGPQLPSEGIKLSLSEVEVERVEVRGKEVRERSDYWGGDKSLESSGSDSEGGSESDTAPSPVQEVDNPLSEEEGYIPAPHETAGNTRVSWLMDTWDTAQQTTSTNISQLNSNSGAVILARTFSRFVKSAVKLCLPPEGEDPEDLILPSLSLPPATQLLDNIPQLLDPVFSWSARLLDLAENQLEVGSQFNLDPRYRPSRSADELNEHIQTVLEGNMPRSSPMDYTHYLLSLSQQEAGDTLPVMDISSYKHVAFILDAQLYFASNWGKLSGGHAVHRPSPDLPNDKGQTFFLRQPSLINSKHKYQPSTEPNFKIPLQRDVPLAQKPHLLKPEASQSILFSAPSDTPSSTPLDPPTPPHVHTRPLSYTQLEGKIPTQPCKLSPRDISSRWKNVIRAFTDLFSQSGPGIEPENLLFTRGGFSGRMARFHNQLNSIKSMGYYGGHCSLQIDRAEMLRDSLTKLFSLDWAWQQSINIQFEGEPGGGEGVVAGFYTALAIALKSSEKMPPRTTYLFHEPGKLPEQATFYAPAPTLLSSSNPLFIQRLSYYRAIGKFFGIAIYYKQPIPFLLTRHVLKYILGRQISWHDLGFYNADLYEGFRRMLEHCQEENISQDTFQATYMLNFEVSINDSICELKPDGKSIAVTPDNVLEYVRLYSMYLMVGCLKEELEELRKGFLTVIPANFIRDLTAEDLQLILTGGSAVVSYARLKRQTVIRFSFYISDEDKTRITNNFYRLIRHMKNTQRQQLLYFGTGSALFASDTAMLTVYVQDGPSDILPTAATCGRTIRMPCYQNYATLKKKVLEALKCEDYAFS